MIRTLLICLGLCGAAAVIAGDAQAQCNAYTTASGSTTFCQGSTGPTLSTSWYTTTTCTAGSYQWQNKVSGAWTAISGATGSTYLPAATGYYRAQIATTAPSTAYSDSIYITVNPLPAATISAAGGTSICSGSGTSLCVTAGSPYTYQWRLNAAIIPGASSTCYTASTAGTYVCTILNTSTGCSATATTTVTINPLPAAPVVATPVTYCQNAAATPLTATGSSLNWYTAATGGTPLPGGAPTPGTSSAGTTSYWVSQTNSSGCEGPRAQISVAVTATPATPIASGTTLACVGSTILLTAAGSPGPYSWTGPNSFTGTGASITVTLASGAAAGAYYVRSMTGGCPSAPDSVVVTVTCLDSVWAGDANYDHLVDNTDALEIALTMGSTGYARSAASIAWLPRYCSDWATTLPGYPSVNRKHADCDGDGVVTFADTLAVTANYGLTHPKGVHTAAVKTAGLPDLYFDLSGINTAPGATITVPIKLGTLTTPIAAIAGIAARIMIDGVTPVGQPSLSYAGSWLGGSSNTLHFSKAVGSNRLDMAYARTDHHNNAGAGTLAWLTFTLPADARGAQMRLYFENVTIADSNGVRNRQFNILDDSVTIAATEISPNAPAHPGLMVLPNPSSGACVAQLSLPAAGSYYIGLRDVTGKLLWQSSGKGTAGLQRISIPVAALSAGTYLLSARCEGGTSTPVQWIKQ